MKVVDARSGKELHEGDLIPFSPTKRIVEIHTFPNAYAVMIENGSEYIQPLIIKHNHPSSPREEVVFYPS